MSGDDQEMASFADTGGNTNNDDNKNNDGEVQTMRRKSEFEGDPLRWEVDGEAGLWDMCIVFKVEEEPAAEKAKARWNQLREERGKLLYQLTSVGVLVSLKWAADRKSLYALLSCKEERYELQAELMGMEFELQPRFGGGFMPFVRSNKSVFLRAYNDEFFTPTQRQAILKDIINQSQFRGGANISILACLRGGVFTKWFPFHSVQTRSFFGANWATWKVWKWFNRQPLDQMQAYFGEELTLYFAWLGFYNYALILPAIVGLGVFIAVNVTTQANESDEIGEPGGSAGRATNIAGLLNTIYALGMMIWVTLYLEFWKRYNSELAFKWNMIEFEVSERSRPEYNGTVQLGVHSRGEWIPFDKDDETLKQVHVVPTIHADPKITKFKVFVSLMPLLVILLIVIIIVLSVLALRLVLQREELLGQYGGPVGSIIGAVLIIIFNILYGKIAVKLADWENHRTDTEYQDSLITKTFMFQFVNTFASLYYIAFGKRANDFSDMVSGFATVRSLRDKCKSRFMDERGEYLQYIDANWFRHINWVPTFKRGVGKPGTLSATDQISNVVWDYVRWDVQFAKAPIFFTDPTETWNQTAMDKADALIKSNPSNVNLTWAGGNATISMFANTTVLEYFTKLNKLSSSTDPLACTSLDAESLDYFRPNHASLLALNLTDTEVITRFGERVHKLLLTEYLTRFEGEGADTIAAETKVYEGTYKLNSSDFWAGAIQQRQVGAGCMSELVVQLATLMLINLAIGQAREILLPLVMVQIQKLLALLNIRKMDVDVDELRRPWEVQAKLVEFQGTFDEYAEMAIQFCLVVAFAAAFPLAPLLALANNVTEVRTDAIKILFTNNKPFYKGAEDIGGWYRILEIIGYIAVVTNSLLILLGFSVLPIAVHGGLAQAQPDVPPAATLSLKCFVFAILIEHAMFVLKYVLAEIVPDMPAEVRQNLARREFLKDELQNELSHRPHFRLQEAAKAAEAGRLFSYDTDSQYVDPDSGAGRVTADGIICGAPNSYLVVAAGDANYSAAVETAEETRKRAKKDRRDKKRLESTANESDAARAVAAFDAKRRPSDDMPPPPPSDPDA